MVDCLGGPAPGATLEQLWSNVAEAAVQSFGLSLEGTCVRFVSCFFHNVVQLFLEATWLCDVLGYTLLGNLRSKVTHCIDLLDRLCKISGPTAVHFYGVAVWQHPWLKSLIFIERSFSFPSSVKLHISSISWSCASSFTWDGALTKVQEKPRKENHLELSSPWKVQNKTRKGKRKLLCF